jgi:hypothetical protein
MKKLKNYKIKKRWNEIDWERTPTSLAWCDYPHRTPVSADTHTHLSPVPQHKHTLVSKTAHYQLGDRFEKRAANEITDLTLTFELNTYIVTGIRNTTFPCHKETSAIWHMLRSSHCSLGANTTQTQSLKMTNILLAHIKTENKSNWRIFENCRIFQFQ